MKAILGSFPLLFLPLLLSLVPGCGTEKIQSHWNNHELSLDAGSGEWLNAPVRLDDKTRVGVSNDSSFIYVALATTDQNLKRQISRMGLTLWFDHEGGKDKRFGVHYPVGFGGFARYGGGQPGDEQGAAASPRPDSLTNRNELDLYGSGEDQHQRMTFAEAAGIEARIRNVADTLVYEMKVPLMDNGHHPFGIGALPGAKIGVGAETMAAGHPPSREGGGESPGGMGGGGRRGGFGGGRGGRGGGGFGGGRSGGGERPRQQMGSPLDEWVTVQLASSVSASQQ